MTKATKFAISFFFLLLISFFVGSLYAPVTNATFSNGKWGSWTDTSACIPSADCGTTNGSKSQSRTCVPDNGCNSECSLAHQVCDQGCPSVTWSDSHQVTDVAAHWGDCPSGYTVDPHHNDKCKKWIDDVYDWRYADKYKSGGNWYCPSSDSSYTSTNSSKPCKRWVKVNNGYTDYVNRPWIPATTHTETFGPITFAYIKSNDQNHCHRPTGTSLGVPSWAMSNFNKLDEHKNLIDVNCRQIPADSQTRNISCTVSFVACPTQTPVPTETPIECPTTYTCQECQNYPEHGSMCSRSMYEYCVENYQCGNDNDNSSWVCQCGSPTETPTITNTPTPTDTPNVGGGDGGSSNPGPPVCNDTDPGIPSNLKATALGGGKVRLDWTAAPGPVTTYAVAFGPSVGNYIYGDPNVGNVTTYTVQALTPGAAYCFYVQAQNGCRGGNPSNVVCSNQGSGSLRILGATTNYNPLVDGLKQSYGGMILGASTELFGTAETVYSADKLPSGNILDSDHQISIGKIGLSQSVYLPQKIGDEYTTGHQEVLFTKVNGNSVYYGHNGTDVFGQIYKLKSGDQISVSHDGQNLNYQVKQILFVHKSEVDKLDSADDNILLTTCSFTAPDYRLIVIASPSHE